MDQPWAPGRTSTVRVVDVIVDHLARSGVRHLFGVGGANIEDLYDAAYFHAGITAVLAKHEFSAATMADYVLVDMFAKAVTGQASPEDAIVEAEKRANRYYRV